MTLYGRPAIDRGVAADLSPNLLLRPIPTLTLTVGRAESGTVWITSRMSIARHPTQAPRGAIRTSTSRHRPSTIGAVDHRTTTLGRACIIERSRDYSITWSFRSRGHMDPFHASVLLRTSTVLYRQYHTFQAIRTSISSMLPRFTDPRRSTASMIVILSFVANQHRAPVTDGIAA